MKFHNPLHANKGPKDVVLKKFRDIGLKLQSNGITVMIYPRFKAFMVDHLGREQSKSAIFLHGVKDTIVVQKYWMVQKDRTIFPKCLITNRNRDSRLSFTTPTEILSTII